MPQDPKAKQQELTVKILLTAIFTLGLAALAWVIERGMFIENLSQISTIDVLLLGIATARLGRMVAYDRVMDPFRTAFTQVVTDNSGEGKSIAPRGSGARLAIGQLVSCPICVGTWIAAIMVFLLLVIPAGGRLFLYIIAAVGFAEIVNSLIEALCWAGRSGRTRSGYLVQKRMQLLHPERVESSHSHYQTTDLSDSEGGMDQ